MKMRYYTKVMLLALYGKKTYFRLLDLEVDLLTLKMTLNHKNNRRHGFSSQNYTKKGITLVPTFIC